MDATGLTLSVRLTPRASRNAVDGLSVLADARPVVAVRVTAAPEGGKANAALVSLLAKTWKLRKSDIEVAAGATARVKRIHIFGDGNSLAKRLENWLKTVAQKK